MSDDMVLRVAKNRLRDIGIEVPGPGLATNVSLDDMGRGLIDIFYEGRLIGQEIIETPDSWGRSDRLAAYLRVLDKKVRLVVMAPLVDSMRVRMMMLELNNRWRFYYMVYGYDGQGRLVRVLRPAPPDSRMSYFN